MAQQPTVSNFLGLAPNRTAFSGQAYRAENVDLSGGGLKPVKAPLFIESGHSGEFVYHEDHWYSGDANYISTDIQGLPLLISKASSGEWKVRVNAGPQYDLWIEAPTGFTLESAEILPPYTPKINVLGAGAVPEGEYEYFVTFAHVENDVVVRESVPSGAVKVTVTTPSRVEIERPTVRTNIDFGSVWRVYRRLVGGTFANLVVQSGYSVAKAYDEKGSMDLGDAIYPEARLEKIYKYRYVIVWIRSIDGWISESVPSELLVVDQVAEGVKIIMPDDVQFPEGVTGWRIYRISLGFDPTTTFQLVTEQGRATREYIDYKDNIELGEALQSSYRADNGALVSAGIPDAQFEGMAGPFNGFYVGWNGIDLYLSQPGNPSWWPGAYVVQANHKIVGISQAGGNIAIVTEGGVQFGYGVSPDAFALSQAIFGIGGVGRKAISRNVYLSHNGIYAISESGVEELTMDFDKDYFDSLNVTGLIYELDKIILFHDAGALMLEGGQWVTLAQRDHAFSAAYSARGFIYGLRDGSIVKLFGSDDDATVDYEGTVDFNEGYTKRIEALRARGSGTVRIELKSIEDTDEIISAGDLNLDSTYWPDKTIYTPSWLDTEALRYRVSGKATVRGIIFEVDKGSTET